RDDAAGHDSLPQAHLVRDQEPSCRFAIFVKPAKDVVDGDALEVLEPGHHGGDVRTLALASHPAAFRSAADHTASQTAANPDGSSSSAPGSVLSSRTAVATCSRRAGSSRSAVNNASKSPGSVPLQAPPCGSQSSCPTRSRKDRY